MDCPLQTVEASFDMRLMRSVIGNVLHNALKYSASSQPVHIRLTDDGQRITLVIADNGIGIPPQDLKHLFDPFHRAANVGTISGTGLGLSIAKHAVDAHHGTIQVQSEVNRGTTVTVTLPKGFVEG
jgi:signal transduction histidine kinase